MTGKVSEFNLREIKEHGKDVYISSNVEIRYPGLISVGSHVAVDSGFYITTPAEIGDYIHIGPYVKVIGGKKGLLKMGNFTNIAAGSIIISGSDSFLGEGLVSAPGIPDEFKNKVIIEPVIFEDFANVGVHCVIFPGVTLARGCVIGANSLVKENTKPWTIYAGNPAKPMKAREKKNILEYAGKLGY